MGGACFPLGCPILESHLCAPGRRGEGPHWGPSFHSPGLQIRVSALPIVLLGAPGDELTRPGRGFHCLHPAHLLVLRIDGEAEAREGSRFDQGHLGQRGVVKGRQPLLLVRASPHSWYLPAFAFCPVSKRSLLGRSRP